MSDAFAPLVDRSRFFFSELSENNTHKWFDARKAIYEAEIKRPAGLLAEVVGDELTRITGEQLRPKLFRIHRDIRFSKDKTPYHTHLHLMWRPDIEGAPSWFLGISPRYLLVGMGLMQLNGPGLDRYRVLIDSQGAEISQSLTVAGRRVGAELSDWGPPPLKRVPKPFSAQHRHAELLKRKSFAVTASFPDGWRASGLVPSAISTFRGLLPTWELLDAAFG